MMMFIGTETLVTQCLLALQLDNFSDPAPIRVSVSTHARLMNLPAPGMVI